jgi:phosphatidylinositol alpha 1,6-mannosyltransferase
MRPPRVAYFPDSFHEVNGVAHTSRNFVAFAQRHDLPFLCVRAGGRPGDKAATLTDTSQLRELELPRSRTAIRLEKDLQFDAIFWRHYAAIEWQLKRFAPDLIHITGPSELGIFGALFAWKMHIPLAASWHTNVHEYLARRMHGITGLLPTRHQSRASSAIERATLNTTASFYRLAQVLFAPNQELCAMLESATGKPCHLMRRGVDTTLFCPSRRTRSNAPASQESARIVLGYVGRLSIEKNIALLVQIAHELRARTITHVDFLIIGQGGDEALLRQQLPEATFPGVLRGEDLAHAYANMDIFLFPSHTDTFGNVVLEALASGVPAIVTPDGGPKYIVTHNETGFIAEDDAFSSAVATLIADPTRLEQMRHAARTYALGCSWDAVFHRVYDAYAEAGITGKESVEE